MLAPPLQLASKITAKHISTTGFHAAPPPYFLTPSIYWRDWATSQGLTFSSLGDFKVRSVYRIDEHWGS
jgi:hypothetical protein